MPALPARRTFTAIGPDSTYRVDVRVGHELLLPALDIVEIRTLQAALAAVVDGHPQADFTVGPDGRLWCPSCSAESARPDECEGAGCPGDNDAARTLRADGLSA